VQLSGQMTRLRTGWPRNRGLIIDYSKIFLLPQKRPDRFWNLPSLVCNCYRRGGAFCGEKRPKRETNHSPPSSGEDKNAWSYTSTPYAHSWRDA
jgi:hypothetical protein